MISETNSLRDRSRRPPCFIRMVRAFGRLSSSVFRCIFLCVNGEKVLYVPFQYYSFVANCETHHV